MPETSVNENPVICSPYFEPDEHWELDGHGMFTDKLLLGRRKSEYLVPVPAPTPLDEVGGRQARINFGDVKENDDINKIRLEVKKWRGGGLS